MHDMSLGLTRQTTYAKLSPEELESMGKQAAVAYLSKTADSLNDAVIKVARQHPSISTHQIKRIAEFANTETFSRLFSDNEKYASDKNIEFPVADPGDILHELDNGARPSFVESSDDYGCDPVKMSSADAVEADLALTKMFLGVDPASPGSEKTVVAQATLERDEAGNLSIERILLVGESTVKTAGAVADRILAAGEEGTRGRQAGSLITSDDTHPAAGAKQDTYDEAAQVEKVSMGGMPDMPMGPPAAAAGAGEASSSLDTTQHPEVTHASNIRALDRRVEIEKKKQELMTMQAKGMEAMGDQGGMGEGAAGAPMEEAPPAEAAPAESVPAEGVPAGGVPAGGAPVEGEGMPQEAGMEAMPPMASAPAGGPGGMEPASNMPAPGDNVKRASVELTKQAMSYAKSNRPKASAVLDDLRQATSVENIRKMAAARSIQFPQYKSANPYGDLIRAKQKVARLLDDAVAARDTNLDYFKEAQARFSDAVIRHLHSGGGLGEVTHMMGQINPHESAIKVGMTTVIPHIKKHGFDLSKLQAASIQYEMEKGASHRTVNTEHPVVQGYSDMLQISVNQMILNKTASGLQAKFNEVEEVLKKAMVRHVAAG